MLDTLEQHPEKNPTNTSSDHLRHLDYAGAKELVLKEFTKSYLLSALGRSQGNISLAAKTCGMERQALQRLLRRYRISVEEFRCKK